MAEADLAEIWADVALEVSEASATRLLPRIEAAAELLLTFPLAGPRREQLAPDLWVKFQGHYAIYYRPMDGEIVIVRVLHGARVAAAIAESGGFSFS